MAKLVSRNQPLRVGTLFPRGVYSRRVNLELFVPAGAGNNDWSVTAPIGNEVWLLSVDIWIFAATLATLTGGILRIQTGTGGDVNAGLIATRWEPVMDMSQMFNQAFLFFGEAPLFSFPMNKYYSGAGRRFGVVCENSVAAAYYVVVSFEISEG